MTSIEADPSSWNYCLVREGLFIGSCALAAAALAHPIGAFGGAIFGATFSATSEFYMWLGRDIVQIIDETDTDKDLPAKLAYNVAALAYIVAALALSYFNACLVVNAFLGINLSFKCALAISVSGVAIQRAITNLFYLFMYCFIDDTRNHSKSFLQLC